MVLVLDADTSFGSETKGRSRAGGAAYLTNITNNTFVNGAVRHMSKIIETVCASVAEAEYIATFMVGQMGLELRNTLNDLGNHQDKILLTTDNAIAYGINNDTVKIKRTRSIDIKYFWMRDRVRTGDFNALWREGKSSLADFFN